MCPWLYYSSIYDGSARVDCALHHAVEVITSSCDKGVMPLDGNTLGAQHQSHQIFRKHHLGGIPGVFLVEARGIPCRVLWWSSGWSDGEWGEAHSASMMKIGNDVIHWWAIILGFLDGWGSLFWSGAVLDHMGCHVTVGPCGSMVLCAPKSMFITVLSISQ